MRVRGPSHHDHWMIEMNNAPCARRVLVPLVVLLALAIPSIASATPGSIHQAEWSDGRCATQGRSEYLCVGGVNEFTGYTGHAVLLNEQDPSLARHSCDSRGVCRQLPTRVIAWRKRGGQWFRTSIVMNNRPAYAWNAGRSWTWVWTRAAGWLAVPSRYVEARFICLRNTYGRWSRRYCRSQVA